MGVEMIIRSKYFTKSLLVLLMFSLINCSGFFKSRKDSVQEEALWIREGGNHLL